MADNLSENLSQMQLGDQHNLPKSARILIIGGGTFGLSTALWLTRNGYVHIDIIDAQKLPSNYSAAYDVNKIVQSTHVDPFYARLAAEALTEGWKKDPVFKGQFHETGIIYCSNSEKGKQNLLGRNKARVDMGKPPFQKIETHEQFAEIYPILAGGNFEGWEGFYQKEDCGWGHSLDSLKSMMAELQKFDTVNFIVGAVKSLVKNDKGDRIVGVETEDGKTYTGYDKTIISAGASSSDFFDFEGQLVAKCWTVAHIKITEEQAKPWKGLPVFFNIEKGFFFEPTEDFHIKAVNEFKGYTNFGGDTEVSRPVHVKDRIPQESAAAIREFLREAIPEYADQEFVTTLICWCTDTADRSFLIDEHPDYNGTLVLATGDSGHGYKYTPVVGKYIARLVTGGKSALEPEMQNKWRWRPEQEKQDIRFGSDKLKKDLSEIDEWTEPLES